MLLDPELCSLKARFAGLFAVCQALVSVTLYDGRMGNKA